MRTLALSMILAFFALPSLGGERFVVHEWGVQVRSTIETSVVIGRKGLGSEQIKIALSAPDELVEDLPPFVLRHEKQYTPQRRARAWDKPVIHFYGPDGLDVSVRVDTPLGRPTAYWPPPELLEATFWRMGDGITQTVGMKWSGKLRSVADPAALRPAPDGHWWKLIREVPGAYFQMKSSTERFIFYEALALQDPAVTGRVTESELILKNDFAADSGPIVVIVNDGKERHFLALPNITANAEHRIARTDIIKASGDSEALLAACRAQWTAFGMTEPEARAIVEIWRPDLLERRGFLVSARLPAPIYEKMFPLAISPAPAETVRAGVVFDTLPGESQRLAWLPALRPELETLAKGLLNEDFDARRKVEARFQALGDLARPFVETLAKTGEPEQREAAARILRSYLPQKMDLPSVGRARGEE